MTRAASADSASRRSRRSGIGSSRLPSSGSAPVDEASKPPEFDWSAQSAPYYWLQWGTDATGAPQLQASWDGEKWLPVRMKYIVREHAMRPS